MPQGYLASDDAFTRRYDEVIKNIPRKVKIVDDPLLYDSSIEGTLNDNFDYLLHCAKNGIVLNKEKFQFCQDTVQFGGLLKLSHSKNTHTDARSWFGLVNLVTFAYSQYPVMLPFHDLVKRDSHFIWNKSLEDAFEHSEKIVRKKSLHLKKIE